MYTVIVIMRTLTHGTSTLIHKIMIIGEYKIRRNMIGSVRRIEAPLLKYDQISISPSSIAKNLKNFIEMKMSKMLLIMMIQQLLYV